LTACSLEATETHKYTAHPHHRGCNAITQQQIWASSRQHNVWLKKQQDRSWKEQVSGIIHGNKSRIDLLQIVG